MRHDPIDPGAGPADERPAFPAAGLRVIDCMSRPVLTIGWQEPLAHAWALMEQRSIRHLPVLDADGALLGIVTESDLREALAAEGIRNPAAAPMTLIVGKAMTTGVVTVSPECPLVEAVELMRARKLSALPVRSGRHVVGILTEYDILRAFAETLLPR